MSAEGGNDQNNNCRRKRRGIMMRPVNYLQLGEMFILKQYPVKHYQNYKPFFSTPTGWHTLSEWVGVGFLFLARTSLKETWDCDGGRKYTCSQDTWIHWLICTRRDKTLSNKSSLQASLKATWDCDGSRKYTCFQNTWIHPRKCIWTNRALKK